MSFTAQQAEAHNARVPFPGCTRTAREPSPPPAAVPGKRIRQSDKPLLNKLETEWSLLLAISNREAKPQAVSFRLANGHNYRPDFVDFTCRPVTAWEVKGPKAFRGGFENIKDAASVYKEIRWLLVWKDDAGQWRQQQVLP